MLPHRTRVGLTPQHKEFAHPKLRPRNDDLCLRAAYSPIKACPPTLSAAAAVFNKMSMKSFSAAVLRSSSSNAVLGVPSPSSLTHRAP